MVCKVAILKRLRPSLMISWSRGAIIHQA
jgi:hypothetical protein